MGRDMSSIELMTTRLAKQKKEPETNEACRSPHIIIYTYRKL